MKLVFVLALALLCFDWMVDAIGNEGIVFHWSVLVLLIELFFGWHWHWLLLADGRMSIELVMGCHWRLPLAAELVPISRSFRSNSVGSCRFFGRSVARLVANWLQLGSIDWLVVLVLVVGGLLVFCVDFWFNSAPISVDFRLFFLVFLVLSGIDGFDWVESFFVAVAAVICCLLGCDLSCCSSSLLWDLRLPSPQVLSLRSVQLFPFSITGPSSHISLSFPTIFLAFLRHIISGGLFSFLFDLFFSCFFVPPVQFLVNLHWFSVTVGSVSDRLLHRSNIDWNRPSKSVTRSSSSIKSYQLHSTNRIAGWYAFHQTDMNE